MEQQELTIENHRVDIFLPDGCRKQDERDVIYMHGAQEEEAPGMYQHLENSKTKEFDLPIVVNISRIDWNADLTPWPAKRIFSEEPDFAGKADQYCDLLVNQIVPQTENMLNQMGIQVRNRGIAGYSLGGLFALYVCTKCERFSWTASVSGSVWYDNFLSYFEEQIRSGSFTAKKVYLSVGDKEHKTRNVRTSVVQECTEQIYEVLKSEKIDSFYELNPGNHFTDVPDRMTKAVKWLVTE